MLQRILALIIKELLALLKDPKGRFVLVSPPIMQLFIFTFAITLEVKNISLGVLNEDSGKYSYELIQRIQGSPYFTHLIFIDNAAKIQPLIDDQKVLGVIAFQSDFSRQVLRKETAEAAVFLDGRKSNTTQILMGYLNNIVGQYNVELKNSEQPETSIDIVSRFWFNPNLEYRWYTVPGLIAILLTVIGIVVTGLTIARERETGTFSQLLVSPLTPFEILIGKTVPAVLIGLFLGNLMLVIGVTILGIPFEGSYLALLLSMFFYLLSVIGIGLFISSICRTQQQAILGSFLFTVPAVLLSGFSTPIQNMPVWLQKITLLDPIRYFLDVVQSLFLKDISFNVVWMKIWPLLCIGLITLSLSAVIFKRRTFE